MKSNNIIMFGGWYQRTTIHLSEIYDFLSQGKTYLDLSQKKLDTFRKSLRLKKVSREVGFLEYVKAITTDGIEIRYYEDGLYILEVRSADIKKSKKLLGNYFYTYFEPAINYIFSLGAPTPKVLADIQTVHPTVIGMNSDKHTEYKIDEKRYGSVYSKISSQDMTVYKTPHFIFVVSGNKQFKNIRDVIEMQIFFREFKDQLEKYLNIHRIIWEHISSIKDRKTIKGTEVEKIRYTLDCYDKTVTLINNRINQMDTYVSTRASIAKDLEIEKYLMALFQYKFEVLTNTLMYIKEIWMMTREYLQSAISIAVEIQNRVTNVNIKSLTLITTLGVVAGIFGYLSRETIPAMTLTGLGYFAILLFLTWLFNFIVSKIYQRIKYKLNFAKTVKKFKK